jgi:hypothetical protein
VRIVSTAVHAQVHANLSVSRGRLAWQGAKLSLSALSSTIANGEPYSSTSQQMVSYSLRRTFELMNS